ncbi:MAG: HAMP domain-containing histidine kinase [Planctomycetaceae bacterium]|jgi:signal transduction histidine kinase|nr:HAMP domain-containing histidine kinase [Planctomycetaceae bacterium]
MKPTHLCSTSIADCPQILDALAEFAAGAGHEINNPLSIINGRAQLLLREITNPEHRQQLEIIVTQTRRAYEMIADVRFFARPPEAEMERFHLREELEKVIKEQTPLMSEHGITLHFEFTPAGKEEYIYSDPVLLHTAVMLLCNNARESLLLAEKRGDIFLRSVYGGGHWTLTFADDGGGIADEVLPYIFDPYYSGRQAGRGLGFGLPKVWRIMQILGGNIRYKNTKQGAAFELELT